MSAKPQNFCLKWKNYQSHIAGIFIQLLQAESMVDVTLSAGGERIHAHRLVLSACSPYFQEILENAEDTHPIVILSEMSFEDVSCLVEFMYKGELNVDADKLSSVLKAAEALGVGGLTEVSKQLAEIEAHDKGEEGRYGIEISTFTTEILEGDESIEGELIELQSDAPAIELLMKATNLVTENDAIETEEQEQRDSLENTAKETHEEKKRRRRKEQCRKEYSEENLMAAIGEMRSGKSLVEAATLYRIPRSTLYVRAKAMGVQIGMIRQEYSGEHVQAAVQAVKDGASLKQASDMFKIPKTVLWRRVQKDMEINESAGNYLSKRPKWKQTYGPEEKQAAVEALERGENLSRVSQKFQIPRTTLFREKARLVAAGKLPWSSLKKRDQENDPFKEHRMTEAIVACKEGKMSQKVASVMFQVPKTTLWRRLQHPAKSSSEEYTVHAEEDYTVHTVHAGEVEDSMSQLHEASTLSDVKAETLSTTEIPVTCITTDSSEIDLPECSVIILTTADGTPLQEGRQIIVGTSAMTTDNEENHTAVQFLQDTSENIECHVIEEQDYS